MRGRPVNHLFLHCNKTCTLLLSLGSLLLPHLYPPPVCSAPFPRYFITVRHLLQATYFARLYRQWAQVGGKVCTQLAILQSHGTVGPVQHMGDRQAEASRVTQPAQ